MVVVNGNIGELQSDIDFYLSVISMDEVSDSNTIRNHFFKIFKNEDNYRSENLLAFQERVSDDYEINLDSEPELLDDEIDINDCTDLVWGYSLKANTLDNENTESHNDVDILENEKTNLEFENNVEHSDMNSLDNEDYEFVEESPEDLDDDAYGNWGNSDDEGELPAFDEDFEILENINLNENKNEIISDIKKTDPVVEVTDVPKDLREFVKMYPNCEVSFALKYFTKRDIDKQLSLGRVFKRKNRLLI